MHGLLVEIDVDLLLSDIDRSNDIFVDGLRREREGFPKDIQYRITADETD